MQLFSQQVERITYHQQNNIIKCGVYWHLDVGHFVVVNWGKHNNFNFQSDGLSHANKLMALLAKHLEANTGIMRWLLAINFIRAHKIQWRNGTHKQHRNPAYSPIMPSTNLLYIQLQLTNLLRNSFQPNSAQSSQMCCYANGCVV